MIIAYVSGHMAFATYLQLPYIAGTVLPNDAIQYFTGGIYQPG